MNVFLIGGLGNNIFQVLGTKHIAHVKYIDTLQDHNYMTRILGWTIHEKSVNDLLKIETESIRKSKLLASMLKFSISKSINRKFLGYKYCPSFRKIDDGQMSAVTGYFHPLTQADYYKLMNNLPDLSFPKKRQIAVHIRRGDIGKNTHLGLLHQKSLNNIINVVSAKYKLPVVVYTNDRLWCKNNLTCEFTFPNNEFDGEVVVSDFLGLCGSEVLICSNSTFSYTAAFLGEHKKIFAPQPFFNDEPIFIPSSWERYTAEYL